MEVQIRTVATIRSCFVGLPAYLIEALQETHDGFLPPMLVLELRSKGSVWHVAWIGMPSSSHSIEISAKLASCIGLPDLIEVHVRVRTDVPKALTIELEPDTEDDWEILELNAEFVEEHVLNQVGILQEGLTFPLWLRGHTVINFHVASTKPAKSVVQLVPGTELAVAPKQRKKVSIANIKDEKDGLEKKDFTVKALLRVQWLDRSLIETCKHGNVSFDVLPTSFAFVSPQTGKYFKLKNGQPVILTTASGGSKPKQDDEMHHGKKKEQNTLGGKQKGFKQTGSKEGGVEVVCQIIFQKGVARGHVMLARSLCRYIHTNLHERVIVRECLARANEVSALLLSPISLQSFQRESINRVNSETIDVKENGLENGDDNRDSDAFVTEKEIVDWNRHQNFLSACVSSDKEGCDDSEKATCKNIVLEAWLSAATSILSKLVTGEGAGSLLIGSNTLLHFEAYSEHGTVTYDVLFLLSVLDGNENLQTDKMHVCYPDSEYCNTCFKTYHLSRESSLCKQDLKLGKPIRFLNEKESQSEGSNVPPLASLTWMDNAAQEALDRLKLILSPKSDWMFNHLNLPSLGHVLLHGPAASGKTQLASALAQHLSDNNAILAHIVIVKCSELAGEQAESLKKSLTRYVNEAIDHAPSILVLDDLDNAISASSGPDGSEPSTSMIGLSEFLADMIDSFQERRRACGLGLVAFLATVKSPEAIPDFLCSSGRFDYHVQISPPAAKERSEILRHQIQKRGLQCDDGIIAETATKCDGYDTSDLEVLVDRAIHAAASRNLSRRIENSISTQISNKPSLLKEDFRNAIENFTPAAMRGISSSGGQGGRMGWEDVGGLFDTRIAIKEMLELPVKYSKIFSEAPLRLRSGVLLYGPPGCGKTHIVGAAAAGCSLRFISVKGPELLNKYIGASEQAVRDVFTKATSAAPCILFFDEFDSIAPKRGHDNTGVTDRVVNQFLTELDGVESLTGVFVFAATSRPDLLDPALLRPGRLDRLLFCDFPNPRERLEILEVLSKKLPIASDVDLGIIASNTEGFSGADLQALLSDAQLESVHQHLNRDTEATSEHPVITNRILESVSAKARPSVSEKERERLYAIYGEFQNSRTAVSAKKRDSKGKRSTLA